jgi:hypothetical protein
MQYATLQSRENFSLKVVYENNRQKYLTSMSVHIEMDLVLFAIKQQSYVSFSHSVINCGSHRLGGLALRYKIDTDRRFVNFASASYIDIA